MTAVTIQDISTSNEATTTGGALSTPAVNLAIGGTGYNNTFVLFTGAQIPDDLVGATILSCVLAVYTSAGGSNAAITAKAQLVNAASPSIPPDWTASNALALKTGVAKSINPFVGGDKWESFPDMASDLQALVSLGGFTTASGLMVKLSDTATAANNYTSIYGCFYGAALAPKLDITYTAAGGGGSKRTLLGVGA